MKKCFLILTLFTGTIVSCKKSSTSTNNDCSITVANLAGSYKITALSYKASSSSTAVDVFNNPIYIDPVCDHSQIEKLNADGTYAFVDTGACTANNATGTWALSGKYFITDVSDTATIASFDCSSLNNKPAIWFSNRRSININVYKAISN